MGYFSQGKAEHDKNGLNGNGAAAKQRDEAGIVKNTVKPAINSVSTLGPGMLITGTIVCEGSAQIFGRVVGDIHAAEIVIGDGAKVEGNITAREVGVHGAFKGTIRGNNVRLKGAASVDGEVFSKSLTVEENVLFEGLSRRLDKPIDLPVCQQTNSETAPATAPTATADAAAASDILV